MVSRAAPLLRLAGIVCLVTAVQACSGPQVTPVVGDQGVGTYPIYSLPTASSGDRVGFEIGQAASKADSPTTLVRDAIDAVARNESLYLSEKSAAALNDEGELTSQRNLLGFESWYSVFGNSLQDDLMLAEEFLQPEWGTVFRRAQADGVHEYFLHIEQWPRAPQLILPYELRGVKSAALLGHQSGEYALAWQHIAAGTQFFLPKRKPHPTANVVRVTCTSLPVVPQAAMTLPDDCQVGGLSVVGWPGSFDQLPRPDFLADAARPLGVHSLSLSGIEREDASCLRWFGYVKVSRSGRYEIQLEADSAARLAFGESGEFESNSSKIVTLHLAQGWHPIQLDWYSKSDDGSVSLRYRTRGGRFHEWSKDELAAPVVVSD